MSLGRTDSLTDLPELVSRRHLPAWWSWPSDSEVWPPNFCIIEIWPPVKISFLALLRPPDPQKKNENV